MYPNHPKHIAIIITPLKAIAEDQVLMWQERGVTAAFWGHKKSKAEKEGEHLFFTLTEMRHVCFFPNYLNTKLITSSCTA